MDKFNILPGIRTMSLKLHSKNCAQYNQSFDLGMHWDHINKFRIPYLTSIDVNSEAYKYKTQ